MGVLAGSRIFEASKLQAARAELCPLHPQKRTLELSREMSALCQKRTFTDPQHGTNLIGQCRDDYHFNCEVGMRERSNPDS